METTNKIAVLLLATQKEYNNGEVNKCLDQYLSTNTSSAYSVDFFIQFNQGSVDYYQPLQLYSLHSSVNQIFINSLELNDHDDMYFKTPEEVRINRLRNLPTLGASSGPNNLFFKSILPLFNQSYENILMIECDSRPLQNNWIDSLVNFVDSSFCIAGSRYRGQQVISELESWSGHLNGVAIYKCSNDTKYILTKAEELIKFHVKHHINKFINFDVGIHYFCQTRLFYNYFKEKNFTPIIDCDIISNYSLDADINLTVDEILQENPNTIILHQKWN